MEADRPSPGGTIVLFDRDGIRDAVSAGLADLRHRIAFTPATPSRLASITKHVLCAFALRSGLDVEAPLGSVLPDVPAPFRDVPVFRALSMTSGLPDLLQSYTLCGVPMSTVVDAQALDAFTDALPGLDFAPGSEMSYSNTGYRLVEQALARQGHAFGRWVEGPLNAALGTGVDVLLGGGWRHFVPNTVSGGKRTDGKDLTALLQTAGYTYVNSGTAFKTIDPAATNKLVGLFNKDHLNYELDRAKAGNNIDEPSLADMTEKAIKILQKNGKGYFLMVEGGRIDHALHGTNAKRALEDTIAFDDAIKRALSLVDLKNTLIVVTADHDHTMTFNGYSHKGNNILGKVTDIKQTTVQGKAVLATAADSKPYTALVFGNGGGPRKASRDDLTNVDTTADDYIQEVGVNLGAVGNETHGGGDVMLLSTGAGNRNFKGTMVNTKVFSLVKSAMGL